MLSQKTYVTELLEKFSMSKSKTLEKSLYVHLKLSKLDWTETGSNDRKEIKSCGNRGIVGCLNYLALTSALDIALAANLVTFFLK